MKNPVGRPNKNIPMILEYINEFASHPTLATTPTSHLYVGGPISPSGAVSRALQTLVETGILTRVPLHSEVQKALKNLRNQTRASPTFYYPSHLDPEPATLALLAEIRSGQGSLEKDPQK